MNSTSSCDCTHKTCQQQISKPLEEHSQSPTEEGECSPEWIGSPNSQISGPASPHDAYQYLDTQPMLTDENANDGQHQDLTDGPSVGRITDEEERLAKEIINKEDGLNQNDLNFLRQFAYKKFSAGRLF